MIRAGDIVKISSTAKVYYNQKPIPDWIKNDKWIVKSVNNDKVIISNNVSGTNSINSPFFMKDLVKVNDGGSAKKPAGGTGKNTNMKISDRGVQLIARYEGCYLNAYRCPAGVWTIGYGHTEGVKPNSKLSSEKEARQLLKKDLVKYGNYVNGYIKDGTIGFALNQNQFDALTSFCYNCGAGNLRNLVKGCNANQVGKNMLLYVHGGGKVLPGLVKRRKEESQLFFL